MWDLLDAVFTLFCQKRSSIEKKGLHCHLSLCSHEPEDPYRYLTTINNIRSIHYSHSPNHHFSIFSSLTQIRERQNEFNLLCLSFSFVCTLDLHFKVTVTKGVAYTNSYANFLKIPPCPGCWVFITCQVQSLLIFRPRHSLTTRGIDGITQFCIFPFTKIIFLGASSCLGGLYSRTSVIITYFCIFKRET